MQSHQEYTPNCVLSNADSGHCFFLKC
ncbi:hypothetical protein J0S82_008766 [Galemys pyrenaicus]|uniref:Uncharacterized protein n=1 Tax=Galemys pyrenaicus TaxID=202257 RepID=A0A8J6A3A1_GALPY|nr:hypothetical protein J0S82_008766 [Galemys pyrenaicus]